MANQTKREGALSMMEQSVLYLLDAYRSEGLSAEEAKVRIAEDIAVMHQKYADANLISGTSLKLGDPIRLLDEIMKTMSAATEVSPIFARAIIGKLTRLKNMLQK